MSWLSINEYSRHTGVSISTIRRHIKSSKIISKKEDGKYFIFVNEKDVPKVEEYTPELKILREQNKKLLNRMRAIQEENNELLMLVKLYEQNQNTATF